MRRVRVLNATRGGELARAARVADGFWSRLRGLLGAPRLEPGEGLLLIPCRSVHSWGMSYPIDVVFLDHVGRVVGLHPDLRPGHRTAWYRDARQVLELPAGALERAGSRLGDRVEIAPARD